MKKIIILTILTISIFLQTGSLLTKTNNISYAGKKNKIENILIEKPDFLPGPSTTDQKKKENQGNIIANKTLPKVSLFIITLIGGLSMVFIIIGGVKLSISFGEEDELTKAKDNIKYAIIGFLVSILSYALVSLVTNVKFTQTSIFNIPHISNIK